MTKNEFLRQLKNQKSPTFFSLAAVFKLIWVKPEKIEVYPELADTDKEQLRKTITILDDLVENAQEINTSRKSFKSILGIHSKEANEEIEKAMIICRKLSKYNSSAAEEIKEIIQSLSVNNSKAPDENRPSPANDSQKTEEVSVTPEFSDSLSLVSSSQGETLVPSDSERGETEQPAVKDRDHIAREIFDSLEGEMNPYPEEAKEVVKTQHPNETDRDLPREAADEFNENGEVGPGRPTVEGLDEDEKTQEVPSAIGVYEPPKPQKTQEQPHEEKKPFWKSPTFIFLVIGIAVVAVIAILAKARSKRTAVPDVSSSSQAEQQPQESYQAPTSENTSSSPTPERAPQTEETADQRRPDESYTEWLRRTHRLPPTAEELYGRRK